MALPKSFIVIGAGIVGCAVARELTRKYPDHSVTVVDKEARIASHQTGHNSGVVHAGLYYEPGGLKARLCLRGVALLKELCADKGLPYDECGKLVVALDHDEEQRLSSIFERSLANGVPGVKMLGPQGIREVEPNAVGVAAIQSPGTAVVDYPAITSALVEDIRAAGGEVVLGCEVTKISSRNSDVILDTSQGELSASHVIVCAGLQSDRIARTSGGDRYPSIVPFFGQYFQLEPAYSNVLNGLIYPVPDPKYPFLGVHFTKRVDGGMMIGPNAFLSLSREKYHGLGLNVGDLAETLTNPSFWRFSARNLSGAAREAKTVLSKRSFLRAAEKYVPSLAGADADRLTRGIRAQAMNADGSLVDDFRIDHERRVTHVRNAPSPGATSSLAIAEHIVQAVAEQVSAA